ncbi:MAG: ABC transporter ATP-binding protein [Clostridia bacterium]|nr:ABC transporter ATP-binding protein [Clostridia bacterium]
MLKRFLSYYKPHKKVFALDMLASFFVSIIAVGYPIVTRNMLNDFIPNKRYSLIVLFGVSLLLLYVVRMLLNYYIQYQGHMMGVSMLVQMRKDLFGHLEKLPFSFFDKNETGKIMSRITNDLTDISELAHHGPETVIISSISVIVSFAYLSTINLWLALIIFACVPLLVAVSMVTRKKMMTAFQESRRSIAEINGTVQSSISGVRVTKAFTNDQKEMEKFEKGNKRFKEARRGAYKAMGQFHSSTTFITDVFNVVVLIAGGLFMYAGHINFADYSAFIVSINLFLNPINTLIRFMEMFQNGAAGFERFVEIMDIPPEPDSGTVEVDRFEGKIEFDNVSCSYDGNREVLKGVNISIDKGDTFALVGPSGGGKTTMCHLIPHFYDVASGCIRIDGIDIRDIKLASLRRNIGIVQQDIYLFNASVRDNILYGRLDASEEEVIEAAKRANIHDYIMSMENGYDTVIGERGVRLSGGQKQRLCIARVFLKNPPILILDEATSALDNATEILIQQSLDELCVGRTTLVVAHRLSTIKNANRIAVVSEGEIIEQGSHRELIEKGGAYAELHSKQFRENEEE